MFTLNMLYQQKPFQKECQLLLFGLGKGKTDDELLKLIEVFNVYGLKTAFLSFKTMKNFDQETEKFNEFLIKKYH